MIGGLLTRPRGRSVPLLGFPRGLAADADLFPIVSPAALTNLGTATATPSINLPAGLTYGDIVVGVVSMDVGVVTVTYPDASWVQMNTYTIGARRSVFFYRICDGSPLDQLATLDLSLSDAVPAPSPARAAGITWRVRGAERQAPIFSGISNNTSTPMNPPNVNLVTTTGVPQTARAALVMVLARADTSLPGLISGYSAYEQAKLSPDDGSSGYLALGCYKGVKAVSEDPPSNSGGNGSNFGVMTCAFLAARSKAASLT